MIYLILSKLFPTNEEYNYVAHPRQVLWGIFIMAVGWATMIRDDWETFGLITFCIGIILSITIIVAIHWEKVTRYWETLDNFANTMIRSNNPDLWMALGFKVPPQQVRIIETIPESKEHGWKQKIHNLPVSPATMQLIADKVLLSGNTDFTSASFSHIPNFRNIQRQLKKEGLLAQKNKKNARIGYGFNKKGMDTLYEYASEGVKLELKRRLE